MRRKNGMIAVFDSGVGGISVLRELIRQMPDENFLYFGDSANAPYGSRPTEEIRALTLDNFARLRARGLKAAVIACNTATSAAIDLLRAQYPDDIIVGIEPALKLAATKYQGGRILVMATEATLREQKFSDLTQRYAGSSEILPLPCPELVEFVERGETSGAALEQYLRAQLAPFLGQRVDAVVLGCTHFPFVKQAIAKVLGGEPVLLDGGAGTARETRRRIEACGLRGVSGGGSVRLENSLQSPQMQRLMQTLLNAPDAAE